MDPARLDFSSLDPSLDPRRWEGLIRGILQRAEPELAQRAAARSSLVALADWARPALAAAVVLVALSAATLLVLEPRPAAPADAAAPAVGLAETLGLPPTIADWVTEERPPSLSELILASGEDLP